MPIDTFFIWCHFFWTVSRAFRRAWVCPFFRSLLCVVRRCLDGVPVVSFGKAFNVSTLRTVCILIGCVAVFASDAGRSLYGAVTLTGRTGRLVPAWSLTASSTGYYCADSEAEDGLVYVKRGVSLVGLQAPSVAAMLMVSDVTGGDFVVTRGTEHAYGSVANSLHPKGLAIDVRVPDEWDDKAQFKARVQAVFEDTEYDLVWYDTHVHIEFDPR